MTFTLFLFIFLPLGMVFSRKLSFAGLLLLASVSLLPANILFQKEKDLNLFFNGYYGNKKISKK
jgi:hypothetical protein